MRDKNSITDKVRVQIILDAISDIESFVQDISYEKFEENRLIKNASAKRLQDLCNASEDLSDELKRSNNDIPWIQMDGLRNRLAHQYFGINYLIVWQIIQTELPSIKTIFESILKTL